MSKLEDLIQELCPDGVEYKKLGDVAEIRSGWGFPNSEQGLTSGDLPFYKVGDMNHPENASYMTRADNYITAATAKKLKCNPAPADTIIFPKIGAAIATNKKRMLLNTAVYDNNVMGIIVDSALIMPRFMFHFFDRVDLMMFTNGEGAVPSIRKSSVEEFEVPVPPMEVQREIVRVLDRFTLLRQELSAELSVELSARRKQYAHYLNSFFEDQDCNYVSLASLGSLTRGKRFVHADAVDDGVPCVHYGELYTYYGTHADTVRSHIRNELRDKMRYAKKGDVIIVGAGENDYDIGVGVSWEGEDNVAVHDACYTLSSHNQNPRYISYYLRSDYYHLQIKKYVSRGKICAISAEGLGKAQIPIPSMERQHEIVEKLSRFEQLCNDISFGLPAEIETRQKQYEYYRDQLLSFKRKEAS